ncbi:Sugar phosphate permease [Pseudomonas sp. NFACC48-1]|uniref:MFS family arabinose efflux permease n=2 Tax=Pseudomonas TaxID=286 RepID=A0AAW8M9B8_9PSED|nr:putative MFS family arabinose efflux permease [Pseudomonas brassicacearum]SCZ39878.1 Sugar phosphate permease [Pseudomonas sp. NFACC44-2]SDA89733.1 Sugar phosphate permease [Pseudomonas sp. NFACC51]SDW43475.1 Sugar phosphate permease [Pseudomonas sp. NFACC08-1]SFI15897.1 Sugar phosphate permease [Pseudomonas sp. NFACC54]SFT28339.1 Sugar phosphate permease [Pseudomonas sp. NFACC48-1]
MSSQEWEMPCATPDMAVYRLTFLMSGLCMGAWAPLVPYARTRAGVDDGALGLLLLCLGLGSLVMMPLAGVLNARKGCRFTMHIGIALVLLTLPMLATTHSFAGLMVALTVFGAGCGAVDVTMNVQGVMVERATGRSLMSGFHGLFSLGTIVSAAGMTALLWLGATPLLASSAVMAALVAFVLTAGRQMLGRSGEEGSPIFVRPDRKVLLLGTLCLLAFLAEGAILDWSAVFLTEERGVEHSIAGLGYATFAVMMALGRLNGDRIVLKLGSRVALIGGGLIVVLGFLMVVLITNWWLNLVGFAVIGAGLANIAPVYLSLAGAQRAMPGELAIAAATSLGYLGILMGPAVIGFVAHSTSLSVALLAVASSMIAVMISATRLIPKVCAQRLH